MLAAQVFDDLAGRRILVIGAGKISELTARSLASRGAEISFVANRTLDRAEELARALRRRAAAARPRAGGARARRRGRLLDERAGYVLDRAAVERSLRARRGRPLFLIDLAVPRDLDPAIHELDGCYLYDIDDLEAVVAETVAGRRREAVRAEEIVAEEAERFRAWHASREVVPAIASLRARAEEIRARELERAEARLGKLSAAERTAVEAVTAGSSTSSCTCRPCA